MFKKLFNYIKNIVKEEYKFIIFLIISYFLLSLPLNYYITVGGGISDVSSRINVKDSYDSKGSFNISYVTQLNGTVLTYGLSYLIPTWERESADDYKFDESESLEDISFRGELDLKTANGVATYWAYTLAGKKVKEISSKLFVISTFKEFETTLKVQDEILSVDNHHYETVDEYKSYMQTKNNDDELEIKIIRDGKEQVINAKLHEANNSLILGVALQYVKEYDVLPKVDIKFKRSEAGPSGGLITTLEIYNQLTKKDLTKGLKIAGTGTIEPDGTIGQIGGVEHKILGAVKDHADIFLVPAGENYQTAKKYIKDKKLKIKIIEVKSIQEAIKKLEGLN